MLAVGIGAGFSGADDKKDSSLSKSVFYVRWYGVGRSALEGLDGVKRVDSGFKGFKEINTVYYDAEVTGKEEMEAALKSAETYLGNAEE